MISETAIYEELKNKLLEADFHRPDLKFLNVGLYPKPAVETPVDIEAKLYIKEQQEIVFILYRDTERTVELRDAMRQVRQFAQTKGAYPMIAGKFFSENDRRLAIQENVGVFDLAGNVYINHPLLHYEKVVTKNPFSKNPPLKDLFAPVASRITRVLLSAPKASWVLTDLAKEADVSLGLTHRIIERMIAGEFVIRGEGGITLKNAAALLNAWKASYSRYAHKKFSYFSFVQPGYDTYRILEALNDDQHMKYALAFFSGADLVASYIRGITKTQFYINKEMDLNTYKRLLDLRPVASGANTEIYIPYDNGVFYGTQKITYELKPRRIVNVVSNIQLYMDLFNNPARGEEAAQHLREVKLKY